MSYLVGGVFIALVAWAAVRSCYLRYLRCWSIATTETFVALERTTDGNANTSDGGWISRRLEAKSMHATGEASMYFRVGEQVTLPYAAS